MAARAKPDRLGAEWLGKLLWPVVALALLGLFNLLFTEGFFSLQWKEGHLFGVPIDVLKNGSLVMLLSLGMTLVIATGGVDLSVGAVMAISGAVAAGLVELGGLPLPVLLGAALGVCLLAGAWNGLLVAVFRVQPLVATLVLMVAGRGVAMLITEGRRITIQRQYAAYDQFVFIGNGFLFYLPLAVTIVAVMLLLTVLVTRKTAAGMFIESVGDNDTASRYAGVNARAVKWAVYAFSGLCAGVAGLIYTSNIRTADPSKTGMYLELDAIMAVVIGGTALTGGRFYILGSIAGALLIQTLHTSMLMHGLSSDEALVPKALVVVFVCLLQSAEFRRRLSRLYLPVGRLLARRALP
jgi:ribose/xylose/arabinose/galactoside ABC-type transport system permease subunit